MLYDQIFLWVSKAPFPILHSFECKDLPKVGGRSTHQERIALRRRFAIQTQITGHVFQSLCCLKRLRDYKESAGEVGLEQVSIGDSPMSAYLSGQTAVATRQPLSWNSHK